MEADGGEDGGGEERPAEVEEEEGEGEEVENEAVDCAAGGRGGTVLGHSRNASFFPLHYLKRQNSIYFILDGLLISVVLVPLFIISNLMIKK